MTDSDIGIACMQLAGEVGQLRAVLENWRRRDELLYRRKYTTQTETDEWEARDEGCRD